jgi:hypothetical protein
MIPARIEWTLDSVATQYDEHILTMASARATIERRRASRLRLRVPLTILHGSEDNAREVSGMAVAVSRCGALLRIPFEPEIGVRIVVVNETTQQRREFRVIRVSERRRDGTCEVGTEMLYPSRDFWGVQFPDEWMQRGEQELEGAARRA